MEHELGSNPGLHDRFPSVGPPAACRAPPPQLRGTPSGGGANDQAAQTTTID